MADICPVCESKMSFFTDQVVRESLHSEDRDDLIKLHANCLDEFDSNPEQYGGKPIEKSEAPIKAEKDHKEQQQEHQKQQQKIEDKSVYVKGFSMPFGEMVEFMVKWAIASIPAFIILFIIGLIFFGIFGALFF